MENTNNTKLNGYRKWAIANDESVSYCTPYASRDGLVRFILTDGRITNLVVDGKPAETTDDAIAALARRYNPYYDEDWDPTYNLLACTSDTFFACGCASCPYFRECENWDNPDGWDNPDYPDDPGYND